MSRKAVLILIAVIFFTSSGVAEASLLINEIMYDLSGSDSTGGKSREWVEIYNPDAAEAAIDAGTWRIYDGSANRTINGEEDFSIPAGAFVIFAGDKDTFLSDHPGFSGIVYDTGIGSLNNTEATIKLLGENGSIVSEAAYASTEGAAGDGNTFQRVSGAWRGALPTPGAANEVSAPPASSGGNGSGGVGGGDRPERDASPPPVYLEIRTKIIVPKIPAFASIPVIFNSAAYGTSGEELFEGRYFWNFGDGDSKEVRGSERASFTHTYFYPGEYPVSLEYFRNYMSEIPDAADKIILRVVPAGLAISGVGDEKDFFVEISNSADHNADLSKWILASSDKSFIFPKNTSLAAGGKLRLSPRLTGFSVGDKGSLKLLNPQGEVVSDYNASLASSSGLVLLSSSEKSFPAPAPESPTRTEGEPAYIRLPEGGEDISIEEMVGKNLPAQAAASSPGILAGPASPAVIIVFGLFLLCSAAGVYLLRRRAAAMPGEDFSILEE